jgi:hypothetical protein
LSKYRKVVIYLLSSKKLFDKKTENELNLFLEELKKLSGLRSTVIHSLWTINEKNTLRRAKYKKDISSDGKILEEKNITMQSINDLPEDILKGIKKLGAFNRNIIKLLGL